MTASIEAVWRLEGSFTRLQRPRLLAY